MKLEPCVNPFVKYFSRYIRGPVYYICVGPSPSARSLAGGRSKCYRTKKSDGSLRGHGGEHAYFACVKQADSVASTSYVLIAVLGSCLHGRGINFRFSVHSLKVSAGRSSLRYLLSVADVRLVTCTSCIVLHAGATNACAPKYHMWRRN